MYIFICDALPLEDQTSRNEANEKLLTYIFMYIHMCIYLYIFVYVCMYVCMYACM